MKIREIQHQLAGEPPSKPKYAKLDQEGEEEEEWGEEEGAEWERSQWQQQEEQGPEGAAESEAKQTPNASGSTEPRINGAQGVPSSCNPS